MLGLHSSLAALTGAPEFRLDQSEAADLARAYSDLSAHYPALLLNSKNAAILNFGQAVAFVYGSRLYAFKLRMGMEKAGRKPPAPSAPAQPPLTPQSVAQNATTQEHVNGKTPAEEPEDIPPEMRQGEIPGVGVVQFPEDHALFGGKRKTH